MKKSSVQNSLQVDKLQNKTRNEFGEKEKQEIVKLVSEHGHAASYEIQGKVLDIYWKYYLTFSQEIQEKFERKEESKQGGCSKDRSNM